MTNNDEMVDLIDSVERALGILTSAQHSYVMGHGLDKSDHQMFMAARRFVKSFRRISEGVVKELMK